MPSKQVDVFGSTAKMLLEEALGYLSTPVHRVFVAPAAEVAWDDCCGGSLYVRVADIVPVRGKPLADGSPCALIGWDVTFALGTVRCAETVDDRGRAPRATALTADALVLTQDAADLGQFLQCRVAVQNLRWTALGPEGGCMSGEWTFMLRLPACGCKEV